MSVSFTDFSPETIAWQNDFAAEFFNEVDWSTGVHEFLMSGSVGSAKSTLMAWIAIHECLAFPRNRGLLCRKSLPDLKKTIFQACVELLQDSDMVEGIDYHIIETTAQIHFLKTGSELISISWADKRYKKFRSIAAGFAIFEELTENNEEQSQAYHECLMRVGRLNHVKRSFVISATNPDDPGHWAYKHFITTEDNSRHVHYSVTEDNPFLPKTYVEKLKKNLDPLMAERMLYGKWIEISKDKLYYSYERSRNYVDQHYKIDTNYPIAICYDFNIGAGKPFSTVLGQYIDDHFHFFTEVIINGARTLDQLEEMAGRGYLDHNTTYEVYGDATGEARTTKAIHSDYDIIKKFLSNYRAPDGRSLQYKMCVPRANPPIRERHNTVNSYCYNANKEIRLHVYKDCKTLDEGMRLTALKKGGEYIEDDSKHFQHCTTAIGYYVTYKHRNKRQLAASVIG